MTMNRTAEIIRQIYSFDPMATQWGQTQWGQSHLFHKVKPL